MALDGVGFDPVRFGWRIGSGLGWCRWAPPPTASCDPSGMHGGSLLPPPCRPRPLKIWTRPRKANACALEKVGSTQDEFACTRALHAGTRDQVQGTSPLDSRVAGSLAGARALSEDTGDSCDRTRVLLRRMGFNEWSARKNLEQTNVSCACIDIFLPWAHEKSKARQRSAGASPSLVSWRRNEARPNSTPGAQTPADPAARRRRNPMP